MGKLADLYKQKAEKKAAKKEKPTKEPKERKRRRSRKKEEKQELQERINGSAKTKKEANPEREALKEEARKLQDFNACSSYDLWLQCCHWCSTKYPSRYDLTFASPYTKWAFDSEECQRKWYIWHGRKYKSKDDAVVEDD